MICYVNIHVLLSFFLFGFIFSHRKIFFISRHQDLHNQSFYMVSACTNWVGIRADCLFTVLTTAAAFGFSFLVQDQGKDYNGQLMTGNCYSSFTTAFLRRDKCDDKDLS